MSVIVRIVTASKCRHRCGVNVAMLPRCHHYNIMLLSLCVNVVYVSVIVCDTAARKFRHCCGINVTIIVAMLHM